MQSQSNLSQNGLGKIVLQSNSHLDEVVKTIPLIATNFVNKQNLLPFPYGDRYLGQLGVLAAGEDDAVITFELLSGLKAYYQEIGLLSEKTQLIEMPHGNGRRNGFPQGDAVEQLGMLLGENAQLIDSDTGQQFTLVPTLTNPAVEAQAESLGIHTLHQPDSDITNNKARLREASSIYGFDMLPGVVITNDTSLDEIVSVFHEFSKGAWLKFPTGSGGDLVLQVEEVTKEVLQEKVAKVRQTVFEALLQAGRGDEMDTFWPEGDIAPKEFPLVLEADARNFGEVVVIGSNHFRTSPNGVEIYGYFQQITGEQTGEFIGSGRFNPDEQIKTMIDEQTYKVANFNIDNGYFALAGIDYFVIRLWDGSLKVYVLELNSRPIISTYPYIVGERLGINEWTNINVTLSSPVSSIGDFATMIGGRLMTRHMR